MPIMIRRAWPAYCLRIDTTAMRYEHASGGRKKSTISGKTLRRIGTNTSLSAIVRTEAALKTEGFGVISRIDIQKTLKSKIDVDFRPYTILGACNPSLAHEALQLEDKVGLMLPCNVIVQQSEIGRA